MPIPPRSRYAWPRTPGRRPRYAARVALAYTPDSQWRNRDRFVTGREAITAFLEDKWRREHDYRLIKELWAFTGNRIAVRFAYEYHDAEGRWFRAYGNENWEFDNAGLMQRRIASINDLAIGEGPTSLFHWARRRQRPPSGRPPGFGRARPVGPRRRVSLHDGPCYEGAKGGGA